MNTEFSTSPNSIHHQLTTRQKWAYAFCWVFRCFWYWVASLLSAVAVKSLMHFHIGAIRLSLMLLVLKLLLDFKINILLHGADEHERK